jgi:hypothetical protein
VGFGSYIKHTTQCKYIASDEKGKAKARPLHSLPRDGRRGSKSEVFVARCADPGTSAIDIGSLRSPMRHLDCEDRSLLYHCACTVWND